MLCMRLRMRAMPLRVSRMAASVKKRLEQYAAQVCAVVSSVEERLDDFAKLVRA